MLKRTLSTIVLLSILAGALYFGGIWGGGALLAALALAAQWEYYNLRGASGAPAYPYMGLAMGACVLALPIFVLLNCIMLPKYSGECLGCICESPWPLVFQAAILAAIVLWLVLALAMFVRRPPSETHVRACVETVFGVAYVPFLLSCYMWLFLICGLQLWLVVAAVVVVKASDIGGLLVGRVLGRHKIAPRISPKKSWEGLAGSIVFAGATAAAFLYFDAKVGIDSSEWWPWILGACILAVVGLFSDLTESAFKRAAGKKDSGNSIPGIGGALDLCDSLLFAGPTAVLLLPLVLF